MTHRQAGQSFIEYLILVALIAIVVLPAVTLFGNALSQRVIATTELLSNRSSSVAGTQTNTSHLNTGEIIPARFLDPMAAAKATFLDLLNSELIKQQDEIAEAISNGIALDTQNSRLGTLTPDKIAAIGTAIDLGQMFYQDYYNSQNASTMTPSQRLEAFSNAIALSGSILTSPFSTPAGSLASEIVTDQVKGIAVATASDTIALSTAPHVNRFVWWMYENGVGRGTRKPGFPKDYFD